MAVKTTNPKEMKVPQFFDMKEEFAQAEAEEKAETIELIDEYPDMAAEEVTKAEREILQERAHGFSDSEWKAILSVAPSRFLFEELAGRSRALESYVLNVKKQNQSIQKYIPGRG